MPSVLRSALRSLTTLVTLPVIAVGCAGSGDGWIDLLANPAVQWRGYQLDALPAGWSFDTATNVLSRTSNGGDIITREQYGDFELELEWKIDSAGNSGIFYRATEGTEVIYMNATEMQILDNARHADGKNSLTSTGANYALYAPTAAAAKPVGEWNHVRIVADGPHVEHWLNGTKVVEYEMGSEDWAARVKDSKFAQWPAYGQSMTGHLGLQDHGDAVSFRNIRVREITP